MILHFVTAFLLQEINASQEKSQRKSNSPSQTGKVPEGRIGLITTSARGCMVLNLSLPRRGRRSRRDRKHHFPACKAVVWFSLSILKSPSPPKFSQKNRHEIFTAVFLFVCSCYPSATSRAIMTMKPTAKERTPISECSPSDISGMSSSTTT